jgi:hypothetical protein
MEPIIRSRTRITINGKTYGSVDEMPAETRAQYEQVQAMLADRNHNGIPDIAENPQAHATVISQVSTSTRRIVNGREIPGDQALPEEVQSLIGGALAGSSGGVRLSWPTLLALLATVAVIAAGLVWMSLSPR